MEANKIMSADVLDIIFEGRNKEYGAYELRKTYNKCILFSIAGMAGFVLLLFLGYFVANKIEEGEDAKQVVAQEVQLEQIQEEKNEPPPPPPPPKPPDPPKVEMSKFTPPKIDRPAPLLKLLTSL